MLVNTLESWNTLIRRFVTMMIVFTFIFLSLSALASVKTYHIGSSPVRVEIYQRGDGGLTYINVHQNEVTSVRAAKHVIDRYGGKLIRLRHAGGRLIRFKLNNKYYRFDPNRMFTPKGIRMTLKRYNRHYSKSAYRAVDRFSKKILKLLPRDEIVALHNNSPRYSISLFLKGRRLHYEARRIYINPKHSRSNFFLVTKTKSFNSIKNKGFNVVQQHHTRAQDDGSLSIYAEKNKMTYVNVEAAHGHLKAQIQMLEAIQDLR